MIRSALLVVVMSMGAADPSCGGGDTSASGLNAPCTRDKDCKDGLACARGVCADPDASARGDGGGDAALPDASDAGARE